jgi:glycine cleavage system aminomethyltransferase T
MDELPAGDQPFPHGDLAPGAEAVWEVEILGERRRAVVQHEPIYDPEGLKMRV